MKRFVSVYESPSLQLNTPKAEQKSGENNKKGENEVVGKNRLSNFLVKHLIGRQLLEQTVFPYAHNFLAVVQSILPIMGLLIELDVYGRLVVYHITTAVLFVRFFLLFFSMPAQMASNADYVYMIYVLLYHAGVRSIQL